MGEPGRTKEKERELGRKEGEDDDPSRGQVRQPLCSRDGAPPRSLGAGKRGSGAAEGVCIKNSDAK